MLGQVILFADAVFDHRGEEAAMTMDACRRRAGMASLFTPPRPNPECNWRLARDGQAQSPCPPSAG